MGIAWPSTLCSTIWASRQQISFNRSPDQAQSAQLEPQQISQQIQCLHNILCKLLTIGCPMGSAHAHQNVSESEQTFCATYWVMVLAISKGRQKWLTLHSFPPTVQRWSQPPFWFRFEWTFGNFVSRSFPKLVPLVSPKTRPHSAMHEKLVRTCRRRNTQCTLACTYWCTWCTLACTCTIAPGVLHKCSMAHITLTDMHFSQLGAIREGIVQRLVCLLRWPEQQASSKSLKMVCMRDERLARCSCRHPVIINLNLLSLFSWHHPFSSICHHDVTLYQFLKVLNLKTLFVLLSMSNCNRLQAIQPFIREPVQKFQDEKKVHKNRNLFSIFSVFLQIPFFNR